MSTEPNTEVKDLEVGDWFEHAGERFIKVNHFLRDRMHYQAICLNDGRAAFPSRQLHPALPLPKVTKIDKPEWAQPKQPVQERK